ncbi:unnamed protein product [Linum trigynum]|uniref:Uncharacterized protein n=1 Tax=Linum trigynum TaxID=586398 RepID=A0AAV2GN89_9ROSI
MRKLLPIRPAFRSGPPPKSKPLHIRPALRPLSFRGPRPALCLSTSESHHSPQEARLRSPSRLRTKRSSGQLCVD